MADINSHGGLDDPDSAEGLGPDLELVATYLAQGCSHAEAGLAVGRSAKWVQRMLRDHSALGERVREMKEHRAAEAAAGLGALLPEAVAAVQRGLGADKPADQLRAAALAFDQFARFRRDSAAAERLTELEAAVDELRSQLEGAGTHSERNAS